MSRLKRSNSYSATVGTPSLSTAQGCRNPNQSHVLPTYDAGTNGDSRLDTIAYSARIYAIYGLWLSNRLLGLAHPNGGAMVSED
jgi:hypothetical protein